jgi:hypothetical protein
MCCFFWVGGKTMARKTTRTAAKKQPAAVETSASIEEQTKEFLSSGHKIQYIDRGVSGQQGTTLSKAKKTAAK